MSPSPVSFLKPPRTLSEQVGLLEQRGLLVADRPAAERFLGSVNYYRFVGYGLGFEEWGDQQTRLDHYRSGTTFQMLADLHNWDSRLRNLLLEALAEVEIRFRTALCYELATETQEPFWHLNPRWMQDDFDIRSLGRECEEAVRSSQEVFVKAFRQKYGTDRVPCWMAIELVSFNKWSKVFGRLRHKDHIKKVAGRMQAPPDDLGSWIHALVVIRNACAHHARLWGRTLSHRPRLTPRLKAWNWPQDRLGVIVLILADLLRQDPILRESFLCRLKSLLAECPQPYEESLGIRRLQEVFP